MPVDPAETFSMLTLGRPRRIPAGRGRARRRKVMRWSLSGDFSCNPVSSLNHPHICTLYDIGQQDGIDFLVMEYLEGETLASRLARGPLPLEQVLRHALAMADALSQAHRQGVFHRDLKPGNIMLT